MKKIFKILFVISLALSALTFTLCTILMTTYNSVFYDVTLKFIIFTIIYLVINTFFIVRVFRKSKYEINKADFATFGVYYLMIIAIFIYFLLINKTAVNPQISYIYLLALTIVSNILLKLYILFATKRIK